MTKQGRYKQSGEQSKKHVHVSENGHTGNKSGCPISKKCGGCQYIDKSYAEQLKNQDRSGEEAACSIWFCG